MRCGDSDAICPHDTLAHELIGRSRVGPDNDIEPVLYQVDHSVIRYDLNVDSGMKTHERRCDPHKLGMGKHHGRADPQSSAQAITPTHGFGGLLNLPEWSGYPLKKLAALVGQLQPGMITIEQPNAEVPFEFGDPPRDRRLRPCARPASDAETAMPGGQNEIR